MILYRMNLYATKHTSVIKHMAVNASAVDEEPVELINALVSSALTFFFFLAGLELSIITYIRLGENINPVTARLQSIPLWI